MPSPVDDLPIAVIMERARASHVQLETIIASFSDEDVIVEHAPTGWSVKDVLHHLAHWLAFAAKQLQTAAEGGIPEPVETIVGERLDAINDEVLAADKAKSLEQARAEFAQAHTALLAVFDTIPTDEADPWWQRWPQPYTP